MPSTFVKFGWPSRSTDLPLTDEQIIWLLKEIGSSDAERDLGDIVAGKRSLGWVCLELVAPGRDLGDREFLGLLYRGFLRRDPDPEGFEHHLQSLAGGLPRQQLVELFALSEEFRTRLPRLTTASRLALRVNSVFGRGGLCVPPPGLISTVAGTADVAWFLSSGAAAVDTLRQTIEGVDRPLEGFSSVLDFGCGCARVLRHLRHLRNVRLHGCDYNPKLIAWCRRHLKFAQFEANASRPPLPYRTAQFDFIYALSVFTHMTVAQQFSWMAELSRILADSGLLLLTTAGDRYRAELSQDERVRFDSGEIIVKNADQAGTNLCAAFHPPETVRRELAKGFSVVGFDPGGAKGGANQDVFLLSKAPTR